MKIAQKSKKNSIPRKTQFSKRIFGDVRAKGESERVRAKVHNAATCWRRFRGAWRKFSVGIARSSFAWQSASFRVSTLSFRDAETIRDHQDSFLSECRVK